MITLQVQNQLLCKDFYYCFSLFDFFHSYSQVIEENIDSLIARMTIEEKVGQMTQINLGFVSSSIDQHDGNKKELDWEKINIAINEFHVGSIFNTNGFASGLFEWHEIINNIQSVALKIY